MYHTGECVNTGQFSRELVGEMIDNYMANAKIMSDCHWGKLIKICSGQGSASRPEDTSSMHQKRCNLYIRSSPMEEGSGA
jgi:hypothetical protein